MKGKIYTPDEANRMLPLVSRIADDIVATYAEVHQALRALQAVKAGNAEHEEAPASVANAADRGTLLAHLDAEVARLLDVFQGLSKRSRPSVGPSRTTSAAASTSTERSPARSSTSAGSGAKSPLPTGTPSTRATWKAAHRTEVPRPRRLKPGARGRPTTSSPGPRPLPPSVLKGEQGTRRSILSRRAFGLRGPILGPARPVSEGRYPLDELFSPVNLEWRDTCARRRRPVVRPLRRPVRPGAGVPVGDREGARRGRPVRASGSPRSTAARAAACSISASSSRSSRGPAAASASSSP